MNRKPFYFYQDLKLSVTVYKLDNEFLFNIYHRLLRKNITIKLVKEKANKEFFEKNYTEKTEYLLKKLF